MIQDKIEQIKAIMGQTPFTLTIINEKGIKENIYSDNWKGIKFNQLDLPPIVADISGPIPGVNDESHKGKFISRFFDPLFNSIKSK